MKHTLILTIFLSLFFSNYITVDAQDEQIKGGWIVETTTIHQKEVERPKKKESPFKTGYQQNVLLSVMTEFDDCLRGSIDYLGGWRFNRCFYAGVGIGANLEMSGGNHENVFDEEIRPFFTMPLYLHARAYIGNKSYQPIFFALSAGANVAFRTARIIGITDRYNPTYLFLEPSVGVDRRLSSRFSINLQVALNIHGVTVCGYDTYNKETEFDLSMRLGFTF